MNDQELIARALEVGAKLRRRDGDLDRLAGALLAEMAARLKWLAADAAQAAEAKPPPI